MTNVHQCFMGWICILGILRTLSQRQVNEQGAICLNTAWVCSSLQTGLPSYPSTFSAPFVRADSSFLERYHPCWHYTATQDTTMQAVQGHTIVPDKASTTYTHQQPRYICIHIYKAPVRYVMVLIVMCDFSHDVRSGVCAAICRSGVLQRNWRMEYIRPYAGRRIGA